MINVVGIGLDGVESLSNKVLKIVNKATVLIGGDRHLNYFLNHTATKIKLGNLKDISEQVKLYLKQEESIVILTSGDPLFFGLGRFLLTQFSSEELQFFPHISSIQLAFNRVKISWQDAQIVSLHGRNCDRLIKLLKKGTEKIAILTDNINCPATIFKIYKSLNIPVIYDFWVCENLGSEDEKVTHFEQEEDLLKQSFSPLNIMVLINNNLSKKKDLELAKLPLFGLPDHLFSSFRDRPGLMTKREVRLIVLGELALQPKQVIWDIGAGTGSVSIEIARLCPSSQIYAVEKTAIGVSLIKKNCHVFQVKNIFAIQGKAPQSLDNLPKADRIFIGGSSGNMYKILEVCQEKINVNGKIVISLATLENLQESINWFKKNQWNYHLLQAQFSRSIPIANLTRFTPLNPITIIVAEK